LSGSNVAILSRDEASNLITQHFKREADTLRGLVDYGTHLLPRCMQSSDRAFADLVVLPILLRHAVAMLDGAAVLLENGCVFASYLQLRCVFETSVYLRWILRDEAERRARAFYTQHLRRKLLWIHRATEGSPEQHSYLQDLGDLSLPLDFLRNAPAGEIDKQRTEIEELLASDTYRDLNKAFLSRRGKRQYDPDWYEVVHPSGRAVSIRTLAKEVERLAAYRLIYDKSSEIMHAQAVAQQIHVKSGVVSVWPLRELREFGHVAQLVMGEALGLFRLLVDRYRPTEGENFSAKYLEEWRQVYLHPRKVTYSYKGESVL
jgi:hypothetical protein